MDTHFLAVPLAVLSLHASASGQLHFSAKKLTSRHGTVRLVMKNPRSSGLDHAIAIEGHGIEKNGMVVGPGGTSVLTLKLKRGRYVFYCPVPGHAAAGMKGTLVVR